MAVDRLHYYLGEFKNFQNAPTYEKVAAEYSDMAFYKVDGDEYPETREGLEIDNLPFVAIYVDGKPVGGMNITKEDMLRDVIEKVRERAGLE